MRIPVRLFNPLAALAFVVALIPATALAQGQTVAVVVPPSQGDPPPQRGIDLGLKGGGMFASLDQGRFKWASGGGITAGAFVEARRGDRLGLTTECTYADRYESNLGGRAHLHFIEVPVLARVTLVEPSRRRAGVYAVVGPALDFNLASTPSGVSSNFNAVDVGAIVGVGLDVRQFVVEARENIGLRQLQENTPGLTSRAFVVTFGVRLR